MIAFLVAALLALPDTRLDATSAQANVDAAIAAEQPGIDAALLLAVGWRETRFISTSVSGRWHFCGSLQGDAHRSKTLCLAMQDLGVGYAVGARELTYWLTRRHGNLAAAVASHACGNVVTDECRAYARHVMRMAATLRAALPLEVT